VLHSHVVIYVVQMTSEWREIDFADADISLLGVMKITDVCVLLFYGGDCFHDGRVVDCTLFSCHIFEFLAPF